MAERLLLFWRLLRGLDMKTLPRRGVAATFVFGDNARWVVKNGTASRSRQGTEHSPMMAGEDERSRTDDAALAFLVALGLVAVAVDFAADEGA